MRSLSHLLRSFCSSNAKAVRRNQFRSTLLESLESRHLMAANPIARDDAAYYTNTNTDLVVSTSSTPAHLLANDLDVDE
jgi:hypothetical protein